jgi:hypothetical protein
LCVFSLLRARGRDCVLSWSHLPGIFHPPHAAPSFTSSVSLSASGTPIASPSSGSAVLRLSFIFSGATAGALSTTSQSTILAAVSSTLGVPLSSLTWLGVTSATGLGLSRELQGGSRVQVGLNPSAASSSSLIQAAMSGGGGGSSVSSAVSSLLSAGFSSALASQPGAASLATALGYTSVSAMQTALSLDSANPVAAVVLSPSPSPTRSPSYSTLSPGETGALVSGILLGCALALYFITIFIVACCVKYTCCCSHAHCKEDYADKSMWCRCVRLKPSMVVQAPPANGPTGDFYPQAPYPYPPPYGGPPFQQQGYPMPPPAPYPQQMAMPYAQYSSYATPVAYPAKQG